MKAQMYFDSKTVGGGGICRANSIVASGSGSSSPSNISSNGGVDGDSGDSQGSKRKVRKCKRVKRIERNPLAMKRRNEIGEGDREVKGEMIKEYLCKLQEIVPFSRKDKRLSKLEVITNAIDYIRELRETLGLTPSFSFAELSQQSEAVPLSTPHQLPSLSVPTSGSPTSSPFYSHIPDNCHHGSTAEDISSSSQIADEACPGLSHPHEQHSQSMNNGLEVWGNLQPSLWTISVPHNHDNDTNTSSSISSVSSDINTST